MKDENKPKANEAMWLFTVGCIIGFILETLWYFIKNGIWINKQGLLYGPFKPIYGTGFVLIVFLMYNFKNKNKFLKFGVGIALGSLFEYFCSLFQEYALGTSTWNYSNFNFNIAGRIYLPYCLAWGLITLLCIDYLYPWFKKLYLNIPNKILKELTISLTIFMTLNITLTTLATIRYADRAINEETNSYIFKAIDELYPDEYMKNKFPKLQILKK